LPGTGMWVGSTKDLNPASLMWVRRNSDSPAYNAMKPLKNKRLVGSGQAHVFASPLF
jgi:hypothetical protein